MGRERLALFWHFVLAISVFHCKVDKNVKRET